VLGGCGAAPDPPRTDTAPAGGRVNPAAVVTVGSSLPSGYEIAEMDGPTGAAALIGFGPGWTADPPRCAALTDPVPGDPRSRGLSASGPGGTVFVAVAAAGGAPGTALLAECQSWTITFVHTSAVVSQRAAPPVEGAQTLAWQAAARTVVEAGSQTNSEATAAFAFFDGHVALVVLVTDPGSAGPPLGARFVDGLLADTVAAVRG